MQVYTWKAKWIENKRKKEKKGNGEEILQGPVSLTDLIIFHLALWILSYTCTLPNFIFLFHFKLLPCMHGFRWTTYVYAVVHILKQGLTDNIYAMANKSCSISKHHACMNVHGYPVSVMLVHINLFQNVGFRTSPKFGVKYEVERQDETVCMAKVYIR